MFVSFVHFIKKHDSIVATSNYGYSVSFIVM
jgi:hypothetical protein